MFDRLFNRKKEVPIKELSDGLLKLLIGHAKSFVHQVKENPKSSFHSIDEEILYRELMILSFWNLSFLQCPYNLLKTTLNNYFQLIGMDGKEKEGELKFMKERSNAYDESWKTASDEAIYYF